MNLSQSDYLTFMSLHGYTVYPTRVGHHIEWIDEKGEHRVSETKTEWPPQVDLTVQIKEAVLAGMQWRLNALGVLLKGMRHPIDSVHFWYGDSSLWGRMTTALTRGEIEALLDGYSVEWTGDREFSIRKVTSVSTSLSAV